MLRWGTRLAAAIGLALVLLLLAGSARSWAGGSASAQIPRPRPVAYVWDYADPVSQRIGARRLLEDAGFEVWPLPLDRSPWELSGLIFIGSFASESPEYEKYFQEYADDLVDFVEQGNVVVQMTQSAWTEATPSFLPRNLRARRTDDELWHVYVTSTGHPLLAGIPMRDSGRIRPLGRRAVWNALSAQFGFEVILAADRFAQQPALMEAAFGRGRFILSAMPFDKVDAPPEAIPVAGGAERAVPFELDWNQFNRAFFANLRTYVEEVRIGNGRVPQATVWRPGGGYARGSWVLGVLPDTQNYVLRFPGLFQVQTDWIVRHAPRLDIRFVVQLGDITDRNSPAEWAHARQAMRRLDGVIPYAMAPGNHDYGHNGDAMTRETLFNRYFQFREISRLQGFGGAMEPEKLDNTFHLFEAGGRKWIVIALEWGPRNSTIEWANSVMAQHPDRVGILITHAYMNNDDRRYDHRDQDSSQNWNPHAYRTPGGVNDGEELWQKLVRNHNFALVLNGHVLGDGTGYLASVNDTGTTTHQILSNYQMRQLGGEGYLRLLEFLPDGRTVRVRTYSPVYEKFLLDPDQHFEFLLDQPLPITSPPK